MAVEIKVPALGESVVEATVAKWFKQPGEVVALDEPLLELETDKVTVEVNAPSAGALANIFCAEGSDVEVGALLGMINEDSDGIQNFVTENKINSDSMVTATSESTKAEVLPLNKSNSSTRPMPGRIEIASEVHLSDKPLSPAVRKLVEDNDLDRSQIIGTGKGGRITKGDVISVMNNVSVRLSASSETPITPPDTVTKNIPTERRPERPEDPREERVRISKLRKIISARLKEAQNTAAMLTTWNEVDMGAVVDLRAAYKEVFEKKHGVRLGFMSYFVRASCIALKEWPSVNAEIHGDEVIYKNYYNIGVAVGTRQGLVVPVLKDADQMQFSDIEHMISDFGRRARDGKLSMEEMAGGTFTISNGGVYGSLNSMPILNVPQSAVLGMHKIQNRPIAVGNDVVVRPMMYLALSYDHRIIDGREAVSFLVRLKECIEDPQRIMLDV